MENKLTIPVRIKTSDCDYDSLLSYPDVFAMFMDMASLHSRALKNDASVLTPRGLFWVTARSKARIFRRPAEGEAVDLSAWPEKPERIRGRRDYTMEQNGERLAEGTTEWIIIDRNTGRFYSLDDLYDKDFEFYPEKVLPEPYYRFFTEFTGEPFAEYTVRSVDIDFEGHMNNVAYIRALFGLFSRKELEEMAPSEIELQYKVSCYEGDRLLWYRQKTDDALEICAKLNGTAVFFARIR